MLRVAAGVLERDGLLLIARRKQGAMQGQQWEFPGGKIEPGETPEECLARELREELGIETEVGAFFCSSVFSYSHAAIELLAYKVRIIGGEIALHDHEEIRWVSLADVGAYDFAAADVPIVQKLQDEAKAGHNGRNTQ